jgi:hypothetical protein
MAKPRHRTRAFWIKLGYAATALWMAGIIVLTDGNTRHPLFRYIFIVPLAGWVVVFVVEQAVKRLRGRDGAPPPD